MHQLNTEADMKCFLETILTHLVPREYTHTPCHTMVLIIFTQQVALPIAVDHSERLLIYLISTPLVTQTLGRFDCFTAAWPPCGFHCHPCNVYTQFFSEITSAFCKMLLLFQSIFSAIFTC